VVGCRRRVLCRRRPLRNSSARAGRFGFDARARPASLSSRSPRPSQDQVSTHDDGIGGAPDEPAFPTLPQSLSESGGGGSDENGSELEGDMQLAFEEQEKSSSAPAQNGTLQLTSDRGWMSFKASEVKDKLSKQAYRIFDRLVRFDDLVPRAT
jgi:hypothetical protein